MRTRNWIRIALLLPVLAGWLTRAVTAKPNILWIVAEDSSPQLGCYGDPFAHTPNLDRLASEGVRFTQASVPYPVCSPSRAAFLTGLYPQQNGQLGLTTLRFAMYKKETPNIVTHLKAAGYRTGILGKLHVSPTTAFPFDYQPPTPKPSSARGVNAAHIRNATTFFKEVGAQPWFLSVNLPDAHLARWFSKSPDDRPSHPRSLEELRPLPWVRADSKRLREVTATYYDGVDRVDEAVGGLLRALADAGFAENTFVVYFSDHGAQFPRGKHTIYEGGLRVPMLMRWPGKIPAGLVKHELVSSVDLLPTMLRVAGVPVPESLLGWDLHPLFRSEPPSKWREYTFGVLAQGFVQEMIRDRRWKLIWSPRQNVPYKLGRNYLDENDLFFHVSGFIAGELASLSPEMKEVVARWESPPEYELYDLDQDPHEMKNLADVPVHAATKARLISALRSMQVRMNDPFTDPANLAAFVTEQVENDSKWAVRPPGSSSAMVNYPPGFKLTYIERFREWRDRHSR